MAASFQEAIVDVLVQKSVHALQETGLKKIVLAGGVSANKHLQTALADAVGGIGASLVHPTPILCTDNAVMIACRGYFMYQNGEYSPLGFERCSIVKIRLNSVH